ncbi:MAG: sulfite exporter TauE/SafE family protein [Prevotellaceae bacterium]|jgi:uncharacterized membrane protein YfcA|nr:sulfite exporter TauE/SafE family protein [Prevotellaceae bacterium]
MDVIMEFLRTTDVFSWLIITILVVVGFFVGFVNTVAGGATALSYILFMGMGMPANVANGTTRLGVMLQFITSSIVYNKEGYLDKKKGMQIGIPVALGSIGGAQFAANLNIKAFEICLSGALLIMLFFLFYDSKKFLHEQTEKLSKKINWKVWLVFLFIGFYGGFTHIGVGIFILVASVLLVGFDLLRANAVKQFAVMLYTPLALLVFALNNQVVWAVGAIYAIGNISGALLATKLAINWGANFIRWFLALIILIFAFYLLYKNF